MRIKKREADARSWGENTVGITFRFYHIWNINSYSCLQRVLSLKLELKTNKGRTEHEVGDYVIADAGSCFPVI